MTDFVFAGNELAFHSESGVDHVDAIGFRERDMAVVRCPGRVFALECVLAGDSDLFHSRGRAIGVELGDTEFVSTADFGAVRYFVVRGPGRRDTLTANEAGDLCGSAALFMFFLESAFF